MSSEFKSFDLAATAVVMTYNQEAMIRSAVLSILNQNCEPIEIIISDDNSSDQTWNIILSLTQGYQGPHKIVLNRNEKNIGIIAHYNQCFEMASCDIIVICGGDDISAPNRAQTLIDEFRKTNSLLVFSDVDKYSLNTKEAADHFLRKAPNFYHDHSAWSAAGSFSLFVGAAAAYHKDLIRKYGPIQKTNIYEDVVLGFRAALEGRVSMIPEQLVKYRLGGLSTKKQHQGDKTLQLDREITIARQSLNVIIQRLNDVRVSRKIFFCIRLKLAFLLLDRLAKVVKLEVKRLIRPISLL